MILLVDRVINHIVRRYRNRVFYKKTGYKVNLIGKITLINTNLKIGKNVTIYPDCMFFGDGLVEIGDNVDIGNGTIIYSSKEAGIYIGNNTLIAAYCYIIDTDHGIKEHILIQKQENTHSKVIIGDDCWLGTGVKVLKGSNIKNGSIIGAQSVVKNEISENAIAVGVPAKVIKYRS